VSVASGTGQVEVPIFIQDNTGTLIGRDQPAGRRITGFGMQVTYGFNACIDTPASPSQQIDKTGGILAGQFADVDSRVKVANTSQSWVYSSSEANGLIPFTAAAAPGDRIGAMVFNLSGCSAGTINLVITASGGTGALLNSDSGASETVGNGLTVVNGAVSIGSSANTPTPTPTPTPSITPTGSLTPTTPTNTPTRTPTNAPQNSPTNTPVGVTPPVINSISPSSGTTRGGNVVTISGDRFHAGAKVFFGNTPAASVAFSNPQQLLALTDAHTAATVDVIVTNPDGGTARLANGFRYAPLGRVPRPNLTPRVVDRPSS
jgi:hypothetical protein